MLGKFIEHIDDREYKILSYFRCGVDLGSCKMKMDKGKNSHHISIIVTACKLEENYFCNLGSVFGIESGYRI